MLTASYLLLFGLIFVEARWHQKSYWPPSDQPYTLELSQEGIDYFGKVSFGHGDKVQELKVLFDTGSRYSYVIDHEADDTVVGTHTEFDSSITRKGTKPLTEDYLTGKITGFLGNDTILMNTKPKPYNFGDVGFVLTKSLSSDLSNYIFTNHDAIIGLSLHTVPVPEGEPDSIFTVFAKELFTLPSFAFFIDPDSDKHYLVFGDSFMNVKSEDFNGHGLATLGEGKYVGWILFISRFTVRHLQENKPDIYPPKNMWAEFVSRSPALIVGPKGFIDDINKQIFDYLDIKVDENYKFPCEQNEMLAMLKDLPDFSIFIDGVNYYFPSHAYVMLTNGGKCQSMIMGKEGLDHFIIGRYFMKQYYTKFNPEQKRIDISTTRFEIPKKEDKGKQ